MYVCIGMIVVHDTVRRKFRFLAFSTQKTCMYDVLASASDTNTCWTSCGTMVGFENGLYNVQRARFVAP